jgi:hypothetical protein
MERYYASFKRDIVEDLIKLEHSKESPRDIFPKYLKIFTQFNRLHEDDKIFLWNKILKALNDFKKRIDYIAKDLGFTSYSISVGLSVNITFNFEFGVKGK